MFIPMTNCQYLQRSHPSTIFRDSGHDNYKLFVGTGCRVGTLINILIKDIDWDGNFITYRHTKSKKLQYIPISQILKKVLQDWLEERGEEPNDFLFPSEDDKQLYPTTVTHNIKTYI